MKKNKYKLEKIVWIDSYTIGDRWGLISEEEMRGLYVESVGFVVKETKKLVLLVPNISDGIHSCCGIRIPKVSIIKRKN